jgi:hypothetical protein
MRNVGWIILVILFALIIGAFIASLFVQVTAPLVSVLP